MKLNIFGRTEQREVIELEVAPEAIELDGIEDAVFDQPVHVAITITRSVNTAYLAGTVEAVVRLECSRCLEPFSWRLTSDFNLVVKQRREGENEHVAEPEDDDTPTMVVLSYGENEMNILPYIRDAVILALPMKPVCREDCQGLCPVCGKNINMGPCGCVEEHRDSRWRALEGLFERNQGRGQ